MQDLFEKYGVLKGPIDYTPNLNVEDFQELEIKKGGYEEERAFEISTLSMTSDIWNDLPG